MIVASFGTFGHRLAGGGAATDGASAVDHLDLPTDRLCRFLHAGGDTQNASVLEIAGEHDDRLARLGLRTAGRVWRGQQVRPASERTAALRGDSRSASTSPAMRVDDTCAVFLRHGQGAALLHSAAPAAGQAVKYNAALTGLSMGMTGDFDHRGRRHCRARRSGYLRQAADA